MDKKCSAISGATEYPLYNKGEADREGGNTGELRKLIKYF